MVPLRTLTIACHTQWYLKFTSPRTTQPKFVSTATTASSTLYVYLVTNSQYYFDPISMHTWSFVKDSSFTRWHLISLSKTCMLASVLGNTSFPMISTLCAPILHRLSGNRWSMLSPTVRIFLSNSAPPAAQWQQPSSLHAHCRIP